MKFVPASAETSPTWRMTSARSSKTDAPSARRMLLQASLLGLCAGLVVIGLIENVQRFADPSALGAQENSVRSSSDGNRTGQSATLALRADRLDMDR